MITETSTRSTVRLGDTIPNVVARSTQGPVQLSDYRGQWLVFFMHPADFTPVCTSEFVALAKAAGVFREMNCALLGLSVDSLFSHLAWVRAIRDRFGITVDFPIIEDPTSEIARAFGVIAPDATDASTVRTTLVIDPDGLVRASMTYPVEVGRSIPEIVRTVRALQRVHGGGILVPADWQPGDDLLREPDQSIDGVVAATDPFEWCYRHIADSK